MALTVEVNIHSSLRCNLRCSLPPALSPFSSHFLSFLLSFCRSFGTSSCTLLFQLFWYRKYVTCVLLYLFTFSGNLLSNLGFTSFWHNCRRNTIGFFWEEGKMEGRGIYSRFDSFLFTASFRSAVFVAKRVVGIFF